MSLIGVGAFVICLIVSRFMNEAAYKHLDKLQKGDLVEHLSGLRKYSLINFPARCYRNNFWFKHFYLQPTTR